ncbi:MAG: GPR endopeptidase [Oscillospiraceae bacterium]|nr:GPR endopeptidase [Oscillospiraceae bacterium]
MSYGERRTDLAVEARELWRRSAADTDALAGVEAFESQEEGFGVTTVQVLNEEGQKKLCKPIGEYVTIEIGALLRREEDAFARAVGVLAGHIRSLLDLHGDERILIVGLGNSSITADAIGPEALRYILVTRHLKQQMADKFPGFRDVSALRSGVLGTTGMESAELVCAVTEKLRPDRVVALDALASCSMDRLCRTVQLTDTGIVPGSGVGNHRAALNRETLGIPVLAVGVPTVVEAATLAIELAERAGSKNLDPSLFGESGDMIVTPRDIDSRVHDAAKLIGYALNVAFHDKLTVDDVDLFL